MRKRIIYGIGSTASSAIAAFKKLNDKGFNDESIYRIWDVDASTKNLEGIAASEKEIFIENDIKSTIRNIIADKHNNEEIYEKVQEVFPVNDESLINRIPVTNAQGSAKNPIVSRLISQIYIDNIRKRVDTDCTDMQTPNKKEAFVLMSSCGGTSTGLNVEILAELIRNNCTIYLFFLSPGYFFRVDATSAFKTNTVATFLRTFYDLEKGTLKYVNPPAVINATIYPFILESEWHDGLFAEYNLAIDNRTDRDLFLQYAANTLKAFFIQHEAEQNFSSRINNELARIRESHEYFNFILLYPNTGYKAKAIVEVSSLLLQSNGKNGKENLLGILRAGVNPSITLQGVDNFILTQPDIIKEKILNHYSSLTLEDIHKAIQYCKDHLEMNRNKWQMQGGGTGTGNTEDEKNPVSAGIEASDKKKSSGTFINLFKNIWSIISPSDNEETEDDDEEGETTTLTGLDKSKLNNLYTWCTQSLNCFNDNLSYLKANNTIDDGNVNFSSQDREPWNFNLALDIFSDKDYIENLISETIEGKIQSVNVGIPPAILDRNPLITLDKSVIINEKNYVLKIFSKIADHDIKYLRGEYLATYISDRNNKKWCYPDRRLQGVLPFDELTADFRQWHARAIPSLRTADERIPEEENEALIAKLCAIAYISDKLNQLDPSFIPVIDFKKEPTGDGFYMEWLNGPNGPLKGESKADLIEVAESFLSKIAQISSNHRATTSNTILSGIIDAGKKQILEYKDSQKVNEAIEDTYRSIVAMKEHFLNNLPEGIRDSNHFFEDIEKITTFFDISISYFGDLMDEFKKRYQNGSIGIGPLKGIQ